MMACAAAGRAGAGGPPVVGAADDAAVVEDSFVTVVVKAVAPAVLGGRDAAGLVDVAVDVETVEPPLVQEPTNKTTASREGSRTWRRRTVVLRIRTMDRRPVVSFASIMW
jgi:hypothetical protein